MTQTHTPATKSFTAAMKDTFGKQGQALGDFAAEMKALSHEDKAWYSAELTKAGIVHTPPTAKAPVTEAKSDKPVAVAA